jgi:hypothetical protein
MPLSWNEIRHRAIQFSHNWAGTRSEAAEKQTFWNEFFDVFGIQGRLLVTLGYKQHRFADQAPINLEATEIMWHRADTDVLGLPQNHAISNAG